MPNVSLAGDKMRESGDSLTRHACENADGLCAIGAPLKTCTDVCEALGIDDQNTMVVASMSECRTRYDRPLWQDLEAWSRS